jgi:hypothetical protein
MKCNEARADRAFAVDERLKMHAPWRTPSGSLARTVTPVTAATLMLWFKEATREHKSVKGDDHG